MKRYTALWLTIVIAFTTALPMCAVAENEYGCSDWATESVKRAFSKQLLDESKSYNYQQNITRLEFCELLFELAMHAPRFLGWYDDNIGIDNITLPYPFVNPFSDVRDARLTLLYHFGIIKGKSEAEFAPQDHLTREEAAVILIRAIEKTASLEASEDLDAYEDNALISDWAMDAVQRISNYGFMQGVGDNRFAPQETYTTEEAIVTVVRVFNKCFRLWEEEMRSLRYVYENEMWNYVTYDREGYKHLKPMQVDEVTFQVLENTKFAKDKDSVYHMTMKVEGADPETFELIEESTGLFYAKDKNKVYVYTTNSAVLVPVIGADPETFEVLECPYAKDKRDAYNGSLPLYVDDVEKFEVLEGNGALKYESKEQFFGSVPTLNKNIEYNQEKYNRLVKGTVLYSNGGRAKTDRQYFEGYRLIEED